VKPAVGKAVLALAGLEPAGRAGLIADVLTIRELGGEALAIATALTAQGPTRFSVCRVPPDVLRSQIRALTEQFRLSAVKLGMVPDVRILRTIGAELAPYHVPWVVDPVVRTSRGQPLSALRPKDYLTLASPSVVLTPNALEAAWLLDRRKPVRRLEEALEAGARLVGYGFGAVLVKGGHLRPAGTDLLCLPDAVLYLHGQRLARRASHRGTGCRFASALAAELAGGASIPKAAHRAKHFVERFLRTRLPSRAETRPRRRR
jgi:hydroxymethylpyrimidine/phosphomethylpyrimidine kinase